MNKIEEEIQQKTFRSGHQKAIINLIYTTSWLQGKQQHFFKTFGITGQQFNILRILKGQNSQSISATEIKMRMLERNSDVSRLLDRLELKKLIIKKTCPVDKRAFDVFISEQGLELLKLIDKSEREMDKLLCISEEEAVHLSDLLDKCRG